MSLLVPVAEASHVIHIVPPVCPMDQLLHGNPFHLHGQAKPVHAKAPLCGPLVRRACGGRLRVRKTGGQRLPFSGVLIRPGCASNTENRHAVSHILAGTKQHAPGSRSNILPGSAPALRSVILYPFSPLPLPLAHPITLTPHPGAYPGAEPWSAPGRVNICFIFWREHCRFPHILRQNRERTTEQDSRLGDPFRGP